MKTILIRQVTIRDPESPLNGQKTNILIINGIIQDIGDSLRDADEVLEGEGAWVMPGLIDLLAYCGEPGDEIREDLQSLSEAAAAGGYTKVAVYSGKEPQPYNGAALSYIKRKGAGLKAELLPIACPSENGKGEEMSELYDLERQGAIAFFNGQEPISDAGLKSRLLEYTRNLETPLFLYPYDKKLAPHGMVHEGVTSTVMGLKGIPEASESTMLLADIELCLWLERPLNTLNISAGNSLDIIGAARKRGLEIKVGVPVHNLLYEEKDLGDFDENYKMLPPLRSAKDRKRLLLGVEKGEVDAVYSNHVPLDEESKKVEFEYSAFGAIGIQTTLNMLLLALGEEKTAQLAPKLLSHGPAEMLGLNAHIIKKGNPAELCIFHPGIEWTFNKENNKSLSANSSLFNRRLKGAVIGTVSRGQLHRNAIRENK